MTVEEFIQKAISAEELLNEMARKLSSTQMPEFSSEPIGVEDASKLIGIPETSIRAGILNGWLPIGVALHNGKQVSGSYRGRVTIGVEDASKLIGIPETSIRAGILNGWLPIGVALHNGKQVSGSYRGRVSFIIYPKKIWELTGHVWRGKEKLRCSENP